MQPINFIANYYGEKQGFYFAWLMFYTSWLMIPAIPGIALFVYQMITIIGQQRNEEPINMDVPWNCLYCIILAVWSTVFIEIWKRREAEIAHNWSMTNYQGDDTEMPDYRSDPIPDSKFGQIIKFSFYNTYMRQLTTEIPIVLISIGIVIACFAGQRTIRDQNPEDARYNLGSSLVNTLIIVVLGQIYRVVARLLTNWENHKYFEDWENSLITKHFAF